MTRQVFLLHRQIVNYFIHPEDKQSMEYERKAMLFINTMLFFILVIPFLFLTKYVNENNTTRTIVLVEEGLLVALLLLYKQKNLRIQIVNGISTFFYTVSTLVICKQGGIYSPSIYFDIAVACWVFFVANKKYGIWSFVNVLICFGVVMTLNVLGKIDKEGYNEKIGDAFYVLNFIFTHIVVLTVILLYEKSKELTISELETANSNLKASKDYNTHIELVHSLETKILLSRMQALSAQINPHFVFNSMNSIQTYLLKNEKEASIHFLGIFSKYMRQVLNNSQYELVTIAQELQSIESYMEIERWRFNQKFEFDIKITPALLNSSFSIPPLLLQPIVENAILHGLLEAEGPCLLSIEVTEGEDFLAFCIEDNGVGRQTAAALNPTQSMYKSMGGEITLSRIRTFNKLYGKEQQFDYAITDLKDSKGIGCGTRVMIHLAKTDIAAPQL